MTKQERMEQAAIRVKALERIVAKPLSLEERTYFENKLAEADEKLRKARLAMLTPRQKRINALMAAGGMK
jgi:hypothetical protein